MKRIILMRHAKSSWDGPIHSDKSRPLNERGKHDAPRMGKALVDKQLIPDVIYASSSKRTTDTYHLISHHFTNAEISFSDDLYLASPKTIMATLRSTSDAHTTCMVIAHNPGITELVNLLGNIRLDNMPTAGVASFVFDSSWADLEYGVCTLDYFNYPKKINK